jgi:hypothetical protein
MIRRKDWPVPGENLGPTVDDIVEHPQPRLETREDTSQLPKPIAVLSRAHHRHHSPTVLSQSCLEGAVITEIVYGAHHKGTTLWFYRRAPLRREFRQTAPSDRRPAARYARTGGG